MTGQIIGEITGQHRIDRAFRRVRLTGGPIIGLPETYKRDRRFRAVFLELTWINNILVKVRVRGPVVRGNGTDGTRQQYWDWHPTSEQIPVWMQPLIETFGTWYDIDKEGSSNGSG